MSVIRVGFIGTGRISDLHAIEYLRSDRARLVAVCDSNLEIAHARARDWGVPPERVFQRYEDLLRVQELDLVEILLPHDLHADVSIDALRAGKHVSVQKPMATTLADADRMVAASTQCEGSLRVFENALFYPPIVKAKALISQGAIGEPLSIRIKANKGDPRTAWQVPSTARAWRQDVARSGGGPLTFDDGHHKFAIAWHFMGMAEEVHAWIDRTEVEPGFALDCPAQISWKFSGQRYGNLEVVYSPGLKVLTDHYAQHDPVEITGTHGVICVTRGHGRLADVAPVLLYTAGKVHTFPEVEGGWEQSFVQATRHHIDTLLTGAPCTLAGGDARGILRFCLAAQRSAREGRAVRLDELN